MSVKNKETGQLEKKEVTVHLECLKQLEQLRQQAKVTAELKKASAENGIAENSTANSSSVTGQKRIAPSPID